MNAGDDETPAGSAWPDIAVRVEARGLVPRWLASSVHPILGPVSGRGMSREAAIRSLVRGMRRSRFTPGAAAGAPGPAGAPAP